MTDQDVTPPQEPQPVEPPSIPEQPQPPSSQPQYPPKELLPEVAVPVQPQYAPPPQSSIPAQPLYPAQQLQPAMPVQPQVSQGDMVRALAATKSYYGAALWTLVLYWLTFWIGGIIANVIYLNSANNAQRLSGVSPEGKGCLWILLITHVVLPLVGICLFYVLGLSGMLLGGTQGP